MPRNCAPVKISIPEMWLRSLLRRDGAMISFKRAAENVGEGTLDQASLLNIWVHDRTMGEGEA